MSTPESTTDGHRILIGGLPPTLPVVVTEQIGAAAAVSAPAAGQASAVIERQLRNILGWTPKAADTSGLLRALEKSYSSVVEDGLTRWIYTPRGTALPIEAAEITGAQGSLYMRAKGAADDMLALLDGFEPMREEADDDAVEAIRAIVRCTLSQIVDEIGREGGPAVPLVDSLFEQLLGTTVTTDPNAVDGDVGRLRNRFYFDREFISGLPDETNFTKFLAFVAYATSLRGSWVQERQSFKDNGTPFFGPQLTKLRRILETLGQNVEEAYVALDSVGIDQTERGSLAKETESGTLFLQPTLEWVQWYVTDAAPRLVDEAGVDGAKSLLPNLVAMANAVEEFIPPDDEFPTLYNTPLVFATLQSLQRGLVAAAEIVVKIGKAPGAFVLVPKEEVVPAVEVPGPDETGAPPFVVTVSRLHRHYTVGIDDFKPGDRFWLEDPSSKEEHPGVVTDYEGRTYCDFDFHVESEPPHYNLMRKRGRATATKLKTIPTTRASSGTTRA